MKHGTTRALYDYWLRRRTSEGLPPSRADIEPSDIHALLGDTFILECDRPQGAPFRLAGTRVCLLFNRELKNLDFINLWRLQDREALASAFRAVRSERTCFAIGWKGYTETDYEASGEMVLLPLTMGGREIARVLGAMVPFDVPVWLGAVPLIALELRSIFTLDTNGEQSVRQKPEPPAIGSDLPERVRKVRHLFVYAGGLQDK